MYTDVAPSLSLCARVNVMFSVCGYVVDSVVTMIKYVPMECVYYNSQSDSFGFFYLVKCHLFHIRVYGSLYVHSYAVTKKHGHIKSIFNKVLEDCRMPIHFYMNIYLTLIREIGVFFIDAEWKLEFHLYRFYENQNAG